jgi:glycerophosphoryl diester phosphodiesterase
MCCRKGPLGLCSASDRVVGHDGPMLVLGHRGASVGAPENTPEAFALADRMGADGVELDVRRALDGRLLVAHDPLPDSPTDVDALSLCTLAEALDACGDRMLVNVEIKNWKEDAGYDPSMSMVAPIIDELRRRGPRARHRWLISSFSWSTVAGVPRTFPGSRNGLSDVRCGRSGDDRAVGRRRPQRIAPVGNRRSTRS